MKNQNTNLPVIWDKELSLYVPSKTEWLVDNLVPNNSLVMFAGKTGNYKTWCALLMAVSVATGRRFLGRFATRKSKVLYIDEENGKETLKERISAIKNGIGINYDLDIAYASFNGIKIDKPEWYVMIEKFLEKHKPGLVIVDAFNRIIKVDENEATQINYIFTEKIRPLIKKYDCSWVLIHHLRKGMIGRSGNSIDDLRGSSEITNYADVVIIAKNRRNGRVEVKQEKCRKAREQAPFMINIEWSNDSVTFWCEDSVEKETPSVVENCCKEIITWLEENEIKNFQTKGVLEAMAEKNFSKATTERALSSLVSSEEIKHISKGHYEITPK